MTDNTRAAELDAIVAELAPLAQRYAFVRAKRLPGIALTTYTRMPGWRSEDPPLAAARYLVWIFGVDDLSDDWSVPLPELRARYATLRAVARGAAAPPGDDLAALLAEVRAALAQLPLWPALADTWARSLDDLLAGMEAERDPAPRESLEAYLAYAHLSIGAMQDAWTLLIVLSDASALAQLPTISAALRAEARVIRLANDLNSADKELAEGKQNALTLLAPYGDARALAEAALAEAIRAFRAAIGQVRTSSGRFEQCIAATADATVAFYKRFTFHEFDHRAQ